MRKAFLLFLVIASFGCSSTKKTEGSAVDPKVNDMLNNQSFTFRANQVIPTGGRTRQLMETFYTLTVNDRKVMADLPYFGRSFNATMGSDGGIKFTSTNYDLTKSDRNKGGWDIRIVPKDVTDIRELNMTVFANGTASLIVNSNNRQPITFQGNIIPVESK
jgi:hypothetical protein